MQLIELTISQFDEFAANHPLRNYCQSSAYAKFMGEQGFSYDYIGYEDDSHNLVAASLILYKKIGMFKKYAYAPKGFLVDYYNVELLKSFVGEVIKRYKARGVIFIKINPEIIVGELKPKKNFLGEYNQNFKIIDDLKELKFRRRREVEPLELLMPRVSPYINLKKFNPEKLAPDFRNLIHYSKHKGLTLEEASSKEVSFFYEFVKDKNPLPINYYRNMLNVFGRTGMVDLLLVKVNYKEFLVQAKESYDIELDHNNECNIRIQENANEANLNAKMESDKLLLHLKDSIVEATEGLKMSQAQYVAGALIIKFQNRVSIISSGHDVKFDSLQPLHFLYNKIVEKYAADYDYVDLNGLSSDFNPGSKHFESNQFKLGFNPTIYEFIGEFDIILDEPGFKRLQARNIITNEIFNQKVK